MPELTPFEQSLEADTTLAVEEGYGPGLPVILVDADGVEHSTAVVDSTERPMRGLFEAAGLDVTPGTSHAPVVSGAPMLHIQVSLVQSALGRPLSRRDSFVVRGAAYRVQQPLEDGFGMLAVQLLEKGDDDV